MATKKRKLSPYAPIFGFEDWMWFNYDGRMKVFRGITRDEFYLARMVNLGRRFRRNGLQCAIRRTMFKTQVVKHILEYFSTVPYKYEGDGLDDYNKYQRPCSNGIGYVAICPGDRGNNVYIDEPTAVKILTRKYNEFWNSNRSK